MHLHRDGATGDADDVGRVRRFEAVEVRQHHLPIDGIEPLNQTVESRQDPLAIQHLVDGRTGHGWFGGQRVERHELLTAEAEGTGDVRGRGVVGDAVDPRAQRTSPVEAVEAPPDREMDVLAQIPTLVLIGLVGTRQPIERRPELIDGIPVAVVSA